MFAAWSTRRAFHEEGESFHAWLMSLMSDEPVEQGAAIDPTAMQVEMPDIPVAGSGGEVAPPPPQDADQRPREIDGDAEEDDLDERNPAL